MIGCMLVQLRLKWMGRLNVGEVQKQAALEWDLKGQILNTSVVTD